MYEKDSVSLPGSSLKSINNLILTEEKSAFGSDRKGAVFQAWHQPADSE
jgi:hypothetical protein